MYTYTEVTTRAALQKVAFVICYDYFYIAFCSQLLIMIHISWVKEKQSTIYVHSTFCI